MISRPGMFHPCLYNDGRLAPQWRTHPTVVLARCFIVVRRVLPVHASRRRNRLKDVCSRILVVLRARRKPRLADRLRQLGFLVECVSSSQTADTVKSGRFDLIVIERLTGPQTQLGVCRAVRQAGLVTPLLIVAAASDVDEISAALKIGA